MSRIKRPGEVAPAIVTGKLFPSHDIVMLIESLGFGLIPIIYDDTSSSEFKDLGFHIHLTKENNVENLKEILLKVVTNFEEEKLKAKDNHEKALNIFALEREKKEYMDILI